MYCPHSNNCARNRMRCADQNSRQSRPEQSQSTRGLSAKPAQWLQLGNFGSHGMNNSPATKICAQGNGSVRGQNDEPLVVTPFVGHLVRAHTSNREQGSRDDAHRLLGIVAPCPRQ